MALTTRILNTMLSNNLRKTIQISDTEFNEVFKPEIMKRAFITHGELIPETTGEHLKRFLEKEMDIRYNVIIDNGELKHFFQKVGVHDYP